MKNIVHVCRAVSGKYGGGVTGFLKAALEALTVLFRHGSHQVYVQAVEYGKGNRGVDVSPINLMSLKEGPFLKELPYSFPCKVGRHSQPVGIIVCVHNALEDVRSCLSSIINCTSFPYRIIIIDDGSDATTRDFLVEFTLQNQSIVDLHRNESARGYTLAANQGLRASTEEHIVLLNSDTVVSEEWLDRMIQCAESDDRIGIVGPLSNTASWQSVPEIEENGDWAPNPLPLGISVAEMAALFIKHSPCLYPRISFLNGFCLLIKRQLIEDIGYFDENTFGRGFCEENDYCLRARLKNWQLAVADDVYVYHAQSKSYSNERRKKLAEESYRDFVAKFGQSIIDDGVRQCRFDKVMLGIRARSKYLTELELIRKCGQKKWQGKKVVFVLPVIGLGGGSNVVIAEATAMMNMGVDVEILNLAQYRATFTADYHGLKLPVIWAENEQQVSELCVDKDVVIATASYSVEWLLPLVGKPDSPKLVYYVQDYEPYFHERGSKSYKDAKESYSIISDIVCVTKSNWNKRELMLQLGLDAECIGVSLNNDLFRPYLRCGESWPDRPLRVVAMIRPNSARRAPVMTMQVFQQLSKICKGKVEFLIFGVSPNDPSLSLLATNFPFTNLGIISSEELASLFTESDIFVDFSEYQAMGLTVMEAMSCGLAVIATDKGGASDFAQNNVNCLVIDTSSASNCFNAVKSLVENDELRNKIQRNAIFDMAKYSPLRCAYNVLRKLLDD